jgi:hypothetical protein
VTKEAAVTNKQGSLRLWQLRFLLRWSWKHGVVDECGTHRPRELQDTMAALLKSLPALRTCAAAPVFRTIGGVLLHQSAPCMQLQTLIENVKPFVGSSRSQQA